MNNGIFVSYDPFAFQSRIILFENGKQRDMQVSSSIDKLAEAVMNLAYSNNCYEVKVHAPMAITEEIQSQIQEYEQQVYSTNKIKVEGI